MAPEHLRGLSPDETATLKPVIRHGLEQLQQASQSREFLDLSQQDPTAEELRLAVDQPAGNDLEGDDDAILDNEPVQPPPETETAEPIKVLPPEEMVVEDAVSYTHLTLPTKA